MTLKEEVDVESCHCQNSINIKIVIILLCCIDYIRKYVSQTLLLNNSELVCTDDKKCFCLVLNSIMVYIDVQMKCDGPNVVLS